MPPGLTIGDFSRITHLSVKMLRRYHESGLLEPAEVDPHTGYRYYTVAQVPTAQVIRRFRDLDMPVREVKEVLAAEPDARGVLIAEHLARLEKQLDATRAAVRSLRGMLEPDRAPITVEHRAVPALPTAAVTATVALGEVLAWYDGAMAEIGTILGTHRRAPGGPPGGLYGNELFTAERGSATVYVPVPDAPTGGRVRPYVVPAAELAVTVHHGPHDDIDVTYGALGSYVTDYALGVAGPVREIYLVGPRETADPAAWRTEIAWPIFRTATATATASAPASAAGLDT